jgi:rare lipoprotein A
VDGERYVPLLHAEGYKEEGLASWYGKEEHGKPTSNGEIFDMFRPSAAHKTLPLGCYIKVTNKSNHKQTVVRVNDRGPFMPGRIVDLSYQSAKELDMVDNGLTPVTIECLRPGFKDPALENIPATQKSYTLQVAAFSSQDKARLLSETLGKSLVYSDIQMIQTAKGCLYRVRAGRFKSRDEAEQAKAAFAHKGYPDTFIVAE